jgi:hypothetical protein
MFLSLHGTHIILVHRDMGISYGSPYVDAHGEMDPGLKYDYLFTYLSSPFIMVFTLFNNNCFFRRGRPLFLDLKRLEDLRQLWIHHEIPLIVQRTLEKRFGEVNLMDQV